MEGSTPPAEPEKKEPTLAEVQEIAIKASEVAAEAKSAAEAKENVQSSIEEETEARGIQFTDEDYKKMADAIIAGMESRGVFEDAPEPQTQTAPPTDAPADTAATPPASDGSSTQQPPAAPAPGDAGPKKRTWAEKFVGRK